MEYKFDACLLFVFFLQKSVVKKGTGKNTNNSQNQSKIGSGKKSYGQQPTGENGGGTSSVVSSSPVSPSSITNENDMSQLVQQVGVVK